MHASDLFRWTVAVPLVALGVWIIFLNFKIVYVYFARREHHSWVPLVGGFLAFIGLGICPLPQIQKIAWVPLGVDIVYCVLILVIGLVMACFAKSGKDDA